MTEPLKIPLTIDALDLAPKPLQPFFTKGEDGKFHLALEGEPPKLAEFRDNNRSLNAAKTELEAKLASEKAETETLKTRLASFDGVDVAEYRALKARPDDAKRAAELETALTSEKAAHAATQFRNVVGWEFLRAGGRPDALDFVVSKAAETFAMADGKVTTKAFSATDPSAPLSIGEWLAGQSAAAAFAFFSSNGGGAGGGAGRGGAPPKRIVDADDPIAVGKNLEGIARGEVDVR